MMGKWLDGILESSPKNEFGKSWEIDPPFKFGKPCHQTGFCVYGTLVEEFPLHKEAHDYAEKMGWTTEIVDGFGGMVEVVDLTRAIREKPELDRFSCDVFGHDCPVFYMAEPLAEDSEL